MIAAVVLAAGASERMGRPKLGLPYAGSTLLGTVVRHGLASSVDSVVVVTGFDAEVVEPLVPDGAAIVRNPDPARGNLSSLRAGVAAVGDLEAVVLLLGDEPQVSAGTIDALVARFRQERPWAVLAEYDGVVAHPFLVSAECVAGLDGLEGPKPLWRYLVVEPPHPVVRVPRPGPVPVDVDDPDDYGRLLGFSR